MCRYCPREVYFAVGVSLYLTGWDSPVEELVHPAYVNLEENSGLGALTHLFSTASNCLGCLRIS